MSWGWPRFWTRSKRGAKGFKHTPGTDWGACGQRHSRTLVQVCASYSKIPRCWGFRKWVLSKAQKLVQSATDACELIAQLIYWFNFCFWAWDLWEVSDLTNGAWDQCRQGFLKREKLSKNQRTKFVYFLDLVSERDRCITREPLNFSAFSAKKARHKKKLERLVFFWWKGRFPSLG